MRFDVILRKSSPRCIVDAIFRLSLDVFVRRQLIILRQLTCNRFQRDFTSGATFHVVFAEFHVQMNIIAKIHWLKREKVKYQRYFKVD